jgi:hypothetical protein
MKCPTCLQIGKWYRADDDKGERLPENAYAFTHIVRSGEIWQCPVCHTFFRYISVTDNDVFCPNNYEELREIPAAEAMAVILQEQADDQEYHQAIQKRFGKFFDTLNPDENEVFHYLINRRWDGAGLDTLKGQFPIENTQLVNVLKGLMAKDLIRETITKSLTMGKSGFQETVDEINDWNIHYDINFSYLDFIDKKKWSWKRRSK